MAYSLEQKQQFITIFRSNATDVSRACKAFGISRKTFYEWYEAEDTTFKEWVDEEREAMKDFGESQLLTLMKGIPKLDAAGRIVKWVEKPDTACIIFYNKTKTRSRFISTQTRSPSQNVHLLGMRKAIFSYSLSFAFLK